MKPFLKAFTAIILLTIGLVTIPHYQSSAQIVKTVTISAADDTLVNADTANVTLTFDGSYKSVEAYVDQVTGTSGGKVYFQGEFPHGGTWADLDSLTISGDSYKLFVVPDPRTYKAYRLRFVASGTQTAAIRGYYVRYTGGFIRSAGDMNWSYNKPKAPHSKYFIYHDQLFDISTKRFFIRRSAV